MRQHKEIQYSEISHSEFNKAIIRRILKEKLGTRGGNINFKKDFPKAYIFSEKYMSSSQLNKVDIIMIDIAHSSSDILTFRFSETIPGQHPQPGFLKNVVEINVDTRDSTLHTSVILNITTR